MADPTAGPPQPIGRAAGPSAQRPDCSQLLLLPSYRSDLKFKASGIVRMPTLRVSGKDIRMGALNWITFILVVGAPLAAILLSLVWGIMSMWRRR
jgi:hypothetical protein